jgi:hypothetical protein
MSATSKLDSVERRASGWGEQGGRQSAAAGPRPLGVRIHVTTRRRRLTRQLAEGVDPGTSPEVAIRAAQLTAPRHRKQLVKTLRRTLHQAHHPPLRPQLEIIDRRAVLDAEEAIDAMIARLSYAEPVRAQGIAIAEQMLSNADDSPLYNRAERGALRQLVFEATEALDTARDASRDFAIAA